MTRKFNLGEIWLDFGKIKLELYERQHDSTLLYTTNYQHRLHQLIVELVGPTLPLSAWLLVGRQWWFSSIKVTHEISHAKKLVSLGEKTDTQAPTRCQAESGSVGLTSSTMS